MSAPDSSVFRPALIVVDVQEDFCPPNGSLAVEGGRDIAPAVNRLLSMPFVLKIATQDHHPADHVSFHTSQHPPNNVPFQSSIQIANPKNPAQKSAIPVWPVHCVQDTPGCLIIPEIDASAFHRIVHKGRDKRLETFSGFADVFGEKSSAAIDIDLAQTLRDGDITHVYVVGLAGDYCVKCTALDARKEGFQVHVVEDATRSVDPGDSGWGEAKRQMGAAGISIIKQNGPEVQQVERLKDQA